MSEPPFAEWLAGLSPKQQVEAEAMVEAFKAFGSEQGDAEYSTWTDKDTPFPIFAHTSFLKAIWKMVNDWRTEDYVAHMVRAGAHAYQDPFSDADVAAARMVGAGASLTDLATFARGIAYSASFDVLNLIDGTYNPHHDGPIGWDLVEYDPERPGPARRIGSLHEAFLLRDPSGREGRPE